MANTTPLDNVQAYAEHAVQAHNIPEISIAVWKNNTLSQAAAGCLNQNTGVAATTDAIFQIGSITKVMTSCLVMQLVDEGLVDLDKPVQHYLHDFMIADADASKVITVRQLLNHTSGIAGDYFPDDHGHQGNLIARYVDRCSLLPLVHPVGEMYSYSNAAFCVAGRLIEVVRGLSWYQVINDYLYQPLGMNHAIADPIDNIRFRAAVGHVYDGDNTDVWVVPERPYLTLGQAPVGTTPAMTAENLIRFARGHMEGGVSQQGQRWLSAASVQAMQRSQIQWPALSQISEKHMGIGWRYSDDHHTGLRVVSHTGGTNGFLSNLLMIPEQNMAVAILMNGYRPSAMDAVTADLMQALAGISMQEPEPASKTPFSELQSVAGVYECLDSRITVTANDKNNTLSAQIIYNIDPVPPLTLTLRHVEGGCFSPYTDSGRRCPNIVFLKPDAQGVPQYLFNGGRLNHRV
jgi:CubicO group peptidase (beta-lactamase class C family)